MINANLANKLVGSNLIPDRQLAYEMVSIDNLRKLDGHARTLTRAHVRRIAKSIEALGWVTPIILDENNAVIAGYGRWQAAKSLELNEVPVVRASGMTDAEKRAYRLTENKLAEIGEWDSAALGHEFELLLDCTFDVELTGFEMADIDALLVIDDEKADMIQIPAPDTPAISRRGDIWHVGPHRLMCGDATNADDYGQLLGGKVAQMVFTDPPYNVEIGGNAAGIRKAKHREFAMASGEMTDTEYTAFLTTALQNTASASAPGAILYVCLDWRHMQAILVAAASVGLEHKQLCVWNKTNAGMGSFYRSQHELVFVFKKAGEHINNFGLGGKGRNRTNVWTYPGANGFREGRSEDLEMHPTVKPTVMIVDAIKDCSKRGDVILDPFAGSGTTLIAAAKTGRRGYAMEIDPLYVDAALRRLTAEVEKEAFLSSGEAFSAVALSRTYGG